MPKYLAMSIRAMETTPSTSAMTLLMRAALVSLRFGRNGLTISCRITVAIEHRAVLIELKIQKRICEK